MLTRIFLGEYNGVEVVSRDAIFVRTEVPKSCSITFTLGARESHLDFMCNNGEAELCGITREHFYCGLGAIHGEGVRSIWINSD